MIIPGSNVQYATEKLHLIGNHDIMELEELVKYAKQTGWSLDYTMMKTKIFNEELRDIVFAVSALTLGDDYSLVPYNRIKHNKTRTRFLKV